jgi:hypothetical protein
MLWMWAVAALATAADGRHASFAMRSDAQDVARCAATLAAGVELEGVCAGGTMDPDGQSG